ncbi:MAG: XapX domain-containing protein [candidate division WOR-3 bacterium]|jgi:XapX domain-containing protein
MKEIILSFLTGFLTGFIFSFLKLPIPAPQSLAGVMGIIGIFVGYFFYNFLFKK